jgi:hypothetical protein
MSLSNDEEVSGCCLFLRRRRQPPESIPSIPKPTSDDVLKRTPLIDRNNSDNPTLKNMGLSSSEQIDNNVSSPPEPMKAEPGNNNTVKGSDNPGDVTPAFRRQQADRKLQGAAEKLQKAMQNTSIAEAIDFSHVRAVNDVNCMVQIIGTTVDKHIEERDHVKANWRPARKFVMKWAKRSLPFVCQALSATQV